MTRYLRTLLSLFTRRRRPVISVNRFTTHTTDLRKKKFDTTAQLAREMGRPNPLRGA